MTRNQKVFLKKSMAKLYRDCTLDEILNELLEYHSAQQIVNHLPDLIEDEDAETARTIDRCAEHLTLNFIQQFGVVD